MYVLRPAILSNSFIYGNFMNVVVHRIFFPPSYGEIATFHFHFKLLLMHYVSSVTEH